ncbi:MAG: type II secretion system protein GspL [Gammaproteobacteria bacterium]|nr:type II secretion system protein GspL [Gammaproteobacteria bacterium]
MRKQLIIRLPSDGTTGQTDVAANASWMLRDEDRPAGSLFHGELKEAALLAAGAQVTVLVPARDVLMAQVSLPVMKRQRLARAVPFALEEQLADDVDDLHVAVGDRDARGRVNNAVVSRARIEAWLEQLRQAGLHPDMVSTELSGVPWPTGADGENWTLLVNGHEALLRTGPQAGLAFDTGNTATVLRAALDACHDADDPADDATADARPRQLRVSTCGDSEFENTPPHQELQALCAEQQVELWLEARDESCSELLARGFGVTGGGQHAINLLQGDYSRKEQLEKLLRPWRPALILTGLWLLLQVGVLATELQSLSARKTQLHEQIEATFHEALPGSRLVPGQERELMQRGLDKLRGSGDADSGLLALLSQSGAVLKNAPGIKLRTLRHKDNKLDLDLELPDLQALDQLKQQLTDKAGLKVDIVSATSRDGKVQARISLRGGAQ